MTSQREAKSYEDISTFTISWLLCRSHEACCPESWLCTLRFSNHIDCHLQYYHLKPTLENKTHSFLINSLTVRVTNTYHFLICLHFHRPTSGGENRWIDLCSDCNRKRKPQSPAKENMALPTAEKNPFLSLSCISGSLLSGLHPVTPTIFLTPREISQC